MNVEKLLEKPLPQMPGDIRQRIEHPSIMPTDFADKNNILVDMQLQSDVGYARLENGNYLVSMVCPMPGITPRMIAWWFWWHPQASIRYQAWFPGEHASIGYGRKDREYFTMEKLPPFQNNTQYPKERIGGMMMPLRIDFVTPETFGFSEHFMKLGNIPMIVCGHVSAFRGLIKHTEMAHICKQTSDGLMLYSRFWIGETLHNPLLRRAILTPDTAKGMAEHCCIEYRNLVEILPKLYQTYGAMEGKEDLSR